MPTIEQLRQDIARHNQEIQRVETEINNCSKRLNEKKRVLSNNVK